MREEIQEMQARETERGLLMTLGDVVFGVGEATLRPGAMEKLVALARFLKDHPDRESWSRATPTARAPTATT